MHSHLVVQLVMTIRKWVSLLKVVGNLLNVISAKWILTVKQQTSLLWLSVTWQVMYLVTVCCFLSTFAYKLHLTTCISSLIQTQMQRHLTQSVSVYSIYRVLLGKITTKTLFHKVVVYSLVRLNQLA